jgi:hypothetical protein
MLRAIRRTLSVLAVLALAAGAALVAIPAHADDADPAIQIFSPSALRTETRATITVSGRERSLEPLSYAIDDDDLAPVEIYEFGGGYFVFDVPTPEFGLHTLRFENALGEQASVEFLVDPLAAISIISPAPDEDVLLGESFDFSAAVDNDHFLNWTLRGTRSPAYSGTHHPGDGPTIDIPDISTAGWPVDYYQLALTGTDADGRQVQASTYFNVGRPLGTITSPTDGEVVGGILDVEGSVLTNGEYVQWDIGIYRLSPDPVYVDSAWGDTDYDPDGEFSFPFDTRGWPDGDYRVSLSVSTPARMIPSHETWFEFVIDNGGSTIDTPTEGQTFEGGTIDVTGTLRWPTESAISYVLDDNPAETLEIEVPEGAASVPFAFDLSDLSQGEHTVTVAAGAGTEVTRTFWIDAFDPLVSVLSPAADATRFHGQTIDFVANVIDTSYVDWTLLHNGTELTHGRHEPTDAAPITVSDIDISGWPAGESHVLTLVTTDRAEHVVETPTTVDVIPPQITIETPEDDAVISTGSFTLSGSIVGGEAATHWVASAPAKPRSTFLGWGASGDSADEFSQLVDTSSWPDGWHTVTVTATDGSGDSSQDEVRIEVDNSALRSGITAPTPGQVIQSSSVRVAGTLGAVNGTPSYTLDCSDDECADDRIDFGVESIAVPVGVMPVFPFWFDLRGLSEGEHTVTIYNGTLTLSRTFVVDLAPRFADLTLTNPSYFAPGDLITVGATITDSSAMTYGLNWGGEPVAQWTLGAGGHSVAPMIDTASMVEGSYELELWAADAAGHSDSISWTVVLDARPGTPTLISPATASSTADKDVEFTWNPLPDADFYEFRYSTSGAVSRGGLSSGTSEYVHDGAESFDVSLSDGDYFWQVRGIEWLSDSVVGEGAWSDVRTLHVGMPPLAATGPAAGGAAHPSPTPGPTPTESAEPTAEPSAEEPVEKTDDAPDVETDEGSAGGSDPTAAGPGDSGFPIVWIIVGVVIVALAGGGFFIRFLLARR